MNVSRETAEIIFDEGRYEDAVFILEILANEQKREYGPNSARTLRTRTRIAEIYEAEGKYVEALKTLLDIYVSKSKLLALNHPSPLATRQRIKNLLLNHGSLEVMSQAMKDIVKTFRYLMKMIRKKYRNGHYRQALEEGGDILDDMMEFLGEYNPITLDMGCLVAVISSHTEDYGEPLRIINDIYEKKKLVVGSEDKRLASTLMARASIYLKMCSFEEAMKCYLDAYSIRSNALGGLHRKTLVSLRCVAEVTYTVGNYERALSALNQIARFQEFYEHKELIFTKIHTGILEFARGNYEDALFIFKDILIKKTTPKRIRAMIQNKKGAALAKLGRYREARIILNDACNTIKSTRFYAETLSTYRNIAVLLANEGQTDTARALLSRLVEVSALVLNRRHSLVFSIKRDWAEFLLSIGEFNEALEAFSEIYIDQEIRLGAIHPVVLRNKCRVAKLYKAQGKHDTALQMFNAILPVLKAQFYSSHLDCLDVEHQIASICLYRKRYAEAYQIYYKIFEIIAVNYAAYHPFLKEIIGKMNNVRDLVPTSRVVESVLRHDFDALVTCVEEDDDINARDVDGRVALHYAAQEGNILILTYLLHKGAIYDIKDTSGYTPGNFSANDETKSVFVMVKLLFESIERGDLDKIRRILQRQRLIINARDSTSRTPLQRAIIKGHFEVVEELLKQGADIALSTIDDGTVLHMAADGCHDLILELLLKHLQNCAIGLSGILINSTNNELGMTALHIAAKRNSYECVDLLITESANPLIPDLLGKLPYDMGPIEMQQYVLQYSFMYNDSSQAYDDGLFAEAAPREQE